MKFLSQHDERARDKKTNKVLLTAVILFEQLDTAHQRDVSLPTKKFLVEYASSNADSRLENFDWEAGSKLKADLLNLASIFLHNTETAHTARITIEKYFPSFYMFMTDEPYVEPPPAPGISSACFDHPVMAPPPVQPPPNHPLGFGNDAPLTVTDDELARLTSGSHEDSGSFDLTTDEDRDLAGYKGD